MPSNFWMILPPVASSLLLAPGLRKFRTAPVMASASGFLGGSASGIGPSFMLVRTFHASHIFSFGSVSCVPYRPFFHRKQSRYRKNSLHWRMQVYKQTQVVQTLQHDFKNVIVKGHPHWKNLHKNCPPHKTDTLPGALLPRYCHDRCFLLPPPTQPSLGGLWLEVLVVTGRTSAFFW